MADNIIGQMFNYDPDAVARQRQQEAMAFAQLDPIQRANYSIYQGAGGLVDAGAGMMGWKQKGQALDEIRTQVMSNIDQNNPADLLKAAKLLGQFGDTKGAMILAQDARTLRAELSRQALEDAQAKKALRGNWHPTVMADPTDPSKVISALYNPDTGETRQIGGSGYKFKSGSGGGGEAPNPQAKDQFDKTIAKMKKMYEDLNTGGGIASENESALSNVFKSTANTVVGQTTGKTFGTKNQTIRNQIMAMRPSLVLALSQMTGRKSGQLNSNFELQQALTQATDPTMGYESAIAQLDNLIDIYNAQNEAGAFDKYGKKPNINIDTTPPVDNTPAAPAANPTRAMPKVGEVINGHRFKGGNPNDKANWIKVK